MPATPAKFSVLQAPIRIGAWDLPNRIIMAPLTRCRASKGRVPNELMADYYSQRAGAGLILTEATFSFVAKAMSERKIAFIFARESQESPRRVPMLKKAFGGAFIANQQLSRETSESLIQCGEADACAWGQLFIANPDLVRRFAGDLPLNSPDSSTFYMGDGRGYTDYPCFPT